jgi:adenosylcobinamide-phosphate synthase
MISGLEVLAAFALDILIGDPRWMPHPVVWVGKSIKGLEDRIRGWNDSRFGGMVLTAVVVLGVFMLANIVNYLARTPISTIGSFIGLILIIWLVSTTFALRGLISAVKGVLDASPLDKAREKLLMIVGRDTNDLDDEGVVRAAIETLSENTSDGVLAPMFYLALGGLPLALTYKAVNTLDSMVGYKNEKYMNIGWASAKLDDIFNYIPARITGVLIVAASYIYSGGKKEDAIRAFRTMLKDGSKHSSPNAGVPEAAMAGALGVRLGGPSYYDGELFDKPFIGKAISEDIRSECQRAIGITITASIIGLALTIITVYLRWG